VSRATVIAAVLACALPACVVIQENTQPDCHSAAPIRLMAAAVPSATRIPCVRSLPLGWDYGSFSAERGEAQFTLEGNDEDGGELVVTLRPACDVANTSPRPSDEQGAQMYEPSLGADTGYRRTRIYTFPGGCAVYRFSFDREPGQDLVASVLDGATFILARSFDATSN
jgi:hypothetical protein